MKYCPECGSHLDSEISEETETDTAEAVMDREVQIARINADKEITLAKIAAKMAESEVVMEAVAETAHAEGVVEGVEAASEPEASEAEPVAVIVNETSEDSDLDGSEANTELPPAEEHQQPAREKSRSYGNSFWYN